MKKLFSLKIFLTGFFFSLKFSFRTKFLGTETRTLNLHIHHHHPNHPNSLLPCLGQNEDEPTLDVKQDDEKKDFLINLKKKKFKKT